MSEREALFDAFVAGFSHSGEGNNGEYPYADKGLTAEDCPKIKAAFKRWLADRARRAAGGDET